MRYEGTADVVAEYDEQISSPSVTWRMPAVIRLRRMPSRNKRGVKFSRVNVYQRDGYRCQYCPQSVGRLPMSELTFDHVVPRASGGKTNWTNIVACCKPCNTRKGSRTCDESGMFPRSEPFQPKSLPLLGPRIDLATAPAEWHAFLPELA
jgi:5-methylcytosine-specific restriction endonuclease McrA